MCGEPRTSAPGAARRSHDSVVTSAYVKSLISSNDVIMSEHFSITGGSVIKPQNSSAKCRRTCVRASRLMGWMAVASSCGSALLQDAAVAVRCSDRNREATATSLASTCKLQGGGRMCHGGSAPFNDDHVRGRQKPLLCVAK